MDLPASFDDLVNSWSQYKIPLYDTKLISQNIKDFSETKLEVLYDRCRSHAKYNDVLKFHYDIGFDRYR